MANRRNRLRTSCATAEEGLGKLVKKDIEQSLQADKAIVTVCAARFARSRTNRANDALPLKRMLGF